MSTATFSQRYELVDATREHLRLIAPVLRAPDRAEVEQQGLVVRHALNEAYANSIICRAAFVDGDIAALWGLRGEMLSDHGFAWLLTAPPVERVPLSFFRVVRDELADMMATRRSISTWVLGSYEKSIRFFAMQGFVESGQIALGPHQAVYKIMTLDRPSPMASPFIVYALPRSRTAWLSQFLSYGGWTCHHEAAIKMRSISDVKQLFGAPTTGTVETAAAPGWKILHHHVPGLRAVVVRRPVDEVVRSMMAVQTEGVVTYDEGKLRRGMIYGDRMLAQITEQPGVLSVNYDELNDRSVCARIFEHCLLQPMPDSWWNRLRMQNIQVSVADVFRYYWAHENEVRQFKSLCWSEMNRLARSGFISHARAA